MKRQLDRDSSPIMKRGYADYDVRDRDLMNVRDRREGSSSRYREGGRDHYDAYDRPSSKRHSTGSRDQRQSSDKYRSEHERQPYRTLCCSNLNPHYGDQAIRDQLNNAFKRFSDFNVRVVHTNDQNRIAFVNFRYPDDARSAAHSVMNKLVIYDMPVRIETVYNNRPYEGYQNYSSGGNREHNDNYRSGGGGNYNESGRDRDYQSGGGGYRDERRPVYRESNSGKFPHHLNHIEPEDDDKATRTLFVGNLDIEITDTELRGVFERYGVVDDIDIKRPQQGNAYAFVKFYNLDMAHRAKVSMSGEYIGKFQCKIGYGKPNPSPCLWVGGLGQWLSSEVLEREFDRFGVIHRIEWPHGESYAYVLYDNVDAATAAIKDMRGYPLGGTDHRLRVDFADLNQISGTIPPEIREQMEKKNAAQKEQESRPRTSSRNEWDEFNRHDKRRYSDQRAEDDDRSIRSSRRDSSRDRDLSPSAKRQRLSPGEGRNGSESAVDVENARSVAELARSLPVAWSGALMLKSSSFISRLHLLSGDVSVVDQLMRDPTSTEMPVLKIDKRLRLDQSKVDDVRSRLAAAGPTGFSVLLAMSGSGNEQVPAHVQQRPMKNLVSYLKQKEAAGIIALPPNNAKAKDSGVLHACPPCNFANDLLTKYAPKLTIDSSKEDYLVIVVVRGSA